MSIDINHLVKFKIGDRDKQITVDDLSRGIKIIPVENKEIDIVRDFEWTRSPKSARFEVPEIHLKEKYITQNPMINQIAYNLGIPIEAGVNLEQVKEGIKSLIGINDTTPEALKQVVENFKDAGSFISSFTPSSAVSNIVEGLGIQQIGQQVIDIKNKVAATARNVGKTIDPYASLYETSDTGINYRMPFFTDIFKQVNNSFSNTDSSATAQGMKTLDGIFGGGLLGNPTNVAQTIGNFFSLAAATRPGTFIEQPKFYDSGADGQTYTFNFPLDNTKSFSDVVRNWEFIMTLLYQNLPRRETRTVLLPPVIYEARVPGVWYSKYAYMSNIQINHIGNKRRMTVRAPIEAYGEELIKEFNITVGADVGITSPPAIVPIPTIIPDCYLVTITIKELFRETQNFMEEALGLRETARGRLKQEIEREKELRAAERAAEQYDVFNQSIQSLPGGIGEQSFDIGRA